MVEPPSPPYIPAKHKGGRQNVIERIVLHSTVSDTECGGARSIARYFQNPTYVSSAHYVVDPCEVYQCVYDHTIAWHDGTNTNSIGVEMCDNPDDGGDRWEDREHRDLLANTARLVRQLCLAYDIPMRRLTPAQIRAGEKGICGHADMRDAFPGSTSHWDPGEFPWAEFISLVNNGGGGGAAPSNRDDLAILTGGTDMLTLPAGGGEDWSRIEPIPIPSILREHDLVIAPSHKCAVVVRSLNTWKNQEKPLRGKDVLNPGGEGDLLKRNGWEEFVVWETAGKSFIVPKGVAKIDFAYWSDEPFRISISPRLV